MATKLVRWALTVAISVALTGTAFVALGAWRRAGDAAWCKQATAGDTATPELLKEQRSACAVQRQRQRTMFGALWRRSGQTTAQCGFELARLQLLADQDSNAAAAILDRYGIDAAKFDASDRTSQQRFIAACLRRGAAGR
jgi:hypothetical protein